LFLIIKSPPTLLNYIIFVKKKIFGYNKTGENMKTIKNEIIDEHIISKSKFITIIKRVDDINLINDILLNIKDTYKGATHYCYAYIINNNKKCSDDKEPQGTAGIPILNVLEKENLSNIICVVIRYYGGIKLGSGGLVRAYTKSVTNALSKTSIDDLVNGLEITITFSYDNIKTIDYLIKNCVVKESFFKEEVMYKVNVSYEEFDLIKDQLLLYIYTIHKKENVFI
jgi:uncharacterized YigZ family protein